MAARLHRDLSDVRGAADAHDGPKALSDLAAFARLVSRESREGHLSATDAQALQTGIAQARRRIGLELPTPTPTPSSAAVAPTIARPPVKQTHERKGKQKRGAQGKGKGHAK